MHLRRLALPLAFVIAGLTAAPAPAAEKYRVTIRRTSHGIPHIVAGDYASLGYGYAYSFAKDAICPLADQYVTVDAERAATFGPNGTYDFSGSNGTTPNNLKSDFFYAKINKQKTIERLLATPESQGGPEQAVKDAAQGFAAGYNRYLKDVGGSKGVTDPACKGKPWVKPITAIQVYRRFYQLALLASSGATLADIADAAPLTDTLAAARAVDAQKSALANPAGLKRLKDFTGGLGSNAVALGSAATSDGGGLLLGNPHFPWDGSARFYESHITIPGKIDVAGASLYGAPVINIGFTRGMAWSHTVSTARRFVPYQLQMSPGDVHSYVVDGKTKKMTATTVTVQSKQANGTLVPVSHTFYDTEFGPMVSSLLGLPVFPWTPLTGFALYDANAENFGRLFNHFLDTNRTQTVPKLDAVERKWQGIPWVNTIAADAQGRAYYADIGSMPDADVDKLGRCQTAIGLALDPLVRVQVLDGSRGGCGMSSKAPGAVAPGLLSADRQPAITRADYVTNSNDSYWLTNPTAPLTGFSRVIGDENSPRALRTRLGLRIVQQRLDGTDGGPATKKFTPKLLMDAVFNDRQYIGELWRDAAVKMCNANPMMIGSNGPVDVSGACPVLAAWDLHDNIDSKGAVLWRRFAGQALGVQSLNNDTLAGLGVAVQPLAFTVPFQASNAVNTPAGLNIADPLIQQALADAVTDMAAAKLPLNAPLGAAQTEERNGERIPIHGGPDSVGDFNVISAPWQPSKGGYPDVNDGSSYVQVVRPTTGRCPDAHTILTYSQSPDRTSPFYADQTRMFSRKQWVRFAYCDKDIAADKNLRLTNLNGGYKNFAQTGTPTAMLRSATARRSGSGVRVAVRTAAATTVRVVVRRAGKRLASRTVRTQAGEVQTIRVAGVGSGARVEIRAAGRAGGKATVVTRRV